MRMPTEGEFQETPRPVIKIADAAFEKKSFQGPCGPMAVFSKRGHHLHHDHNEDTFGFYPKYNGGIIADGVGGAPNGYIAADILTDVFFKLVEDHRLYAIHVVGRALMYQRETSELKIGAACYITFQLFPDGELELLQGGDLRFYLIPRLGKTRITKDQVGEQSGKTVVTNPIGTTRSIREPAPYKWRVRKGDTLVGVTDEVWRKLDDKLIVTIVRESASPEEAIEKIIGLLEDLGQDDDATAFVYRIDRLPEET